MCLAIPAKIEKIIGPKALASWPGLKKEINVCLVAGLKRGDYVLVHVGFAIEKLKPQEARASLKIFHDFIYNEKKSIRKKTH